MNIAPSRTVADFIRGTEFMKILCGPVGGGKSTGALHAMWLMACDQTPHNGTRRTKWVVLRNTMPQLKTTVKPLINQWFVENIAAPLGTWHSSDNTFVVRVRLADDTIVHAEFLLMAADTPDDVRRLLSVECSGAWIEEAREVDSAIVEGLQGRCGRFPNVASGGVKYPVVLCSTNPPPVGTFWHAQMTNPPKNVGVYMQPAALLEDNSINPDAENLRNLPPNYYPNLAEGKSAAWVDVYLKNKFGSAGFGQPVFRGTFNRDLHVAKSELKPVVVTTQRIIVGSDNGLTAAAVIGQRDALGHINILADPHVPLGESMGYDRFLAHILVPRLRELGIPPRHVHFIVDPACFQRSQANEVTIAMIIQRAGFSVTPAQTNNPERRVSAVETLLGQTVNGSGVLRLSPSCTHLAAALEWGFRYKRAVAGSTSLVVEKNHWSHVAESLQYFALYFNDPKAQPGGQTQARTVERHRYATT